MWERGFSRFGDRHKHTPFWMRDLKICFAPVKNILIKMFFSYKYLQLFWILVTQSAIIFGFHLYDIANRIFRFSHSTCFYFSFVIYFLSSIIHAFDSWARGVSRKNVHVYLAVMIVVSTCSHNRKRKRSGKSGKETEK